MRVTQASQQTQFLANLTTLESNISTTENEMSSGDAYTTPSQDPAAAGQVDNYQQVLAQSKQFTSNANSVESSLNTEDTALTNVTQQLQSLRDLALQAASGTESNQNLSSIATQAQQIQNYAAVAGQHPGRQRQLYFCRLRIANAGVHVDVDRRRLFRRSGNAPGAGRDGPNGRGRRQRR
jgi:hypothetical protein